MKLRQRLMMLLLGVLSVTSLTLIACSDDDEDVMGPVAVNSCQVTATTATPIWTLVPNDNCDGYIISLYLGTRENPGQLVESKTFDYRTCQYTFTGLTPDTQYVLSTQAIPSKSSGFSSAEVYWKAFKTAAEE